MQSSKGGGEGIFKKPKMASLKAGGLSYGFVVKQAGVEQIDLQLSCMGC
jgi:hypothetical protein